MHKVLLSIFLICFLVVELVQAEPISNFAPDKQTAEILKLFEELSQIHRRSGEERFAFEWLTDKVFEAEHVWQKRPGIAFGLDNRKGRFAIIGIPATGSFAGRNKSQIIAIQGHMDRVIDGDQIPILEVTRDGWIQSKNNHASIGADNGVGVALMVYLMMHPEIEHPPLELIFTSREEEGLVGAKNFNWYLDSQVLISLDGESSTSLYRGSMGSERLLFSGSVPAETQTDYSRLFRLKLTNLPSGHSGGDVHIHNPQTSAVLARLLQDLPQEISVVELLMGNQKELNKLPSSFEIILYIPKALNAVELSNQLKKKIENTLSSKQRATYKYEFTPAIQNDEVEDLELDKGPPFYTIPSDQLQALYETLDQSPKGVLERKTDLPKSGLSSASIGYAEIELLSSATPMNKDKEVKSPRLNVRFATMIRSFEEDRLQYWVNQQTKTAESSAIAFKAQTLNRSLGWLEDSNSWLVQLVQNQFTDLCLKCAPGGVEIPYIKKSMSGKKQTAVLLGADIEKAHDRHERVSLTSIVKLRKQLEILLATIGDSHEFKKHTYEKCHGVLAGLVKGR